MVGHENDDPWEVEMKTKSIQMVLILVIPLSWLLNGCGMLQPRGGRNGGAIRAVRQVGGALGRGRTLSLQRTVNTRAGGLVRRVNAVLTPRGRTVTASTTRVTPAANTLPPPTNVVPGSSVTPPVNTVPADVAATALPAAPASPAEGAEG
jgi:hypothetical protein